ncbi:hypothetical protein OXYTRIMIC_722 [Oxytricha trifallax]|uniref:Uncharacterized protein n=1 Tax=Oxytricha trifallax TaxID=1172189 RepID=A0A073ICA4_9SPIT|nr:hypothetical protein OXYTRIMIC_722 [Oxytricha trifallax]
MYASDRTIVESFVSEKMPELHDNPYRNIYAGARLDWDMDERSQFARFPKGYCQWKLSGDGRLPAREGMQGTEGRCQHE